jgi:polysaccharide export outer membrane protein
MLPVGRNIARGIIALRDGARAGAARVIIAGRSIAVLVAAGGLAAGCSGGGPTVTTSSIPASVAAAEAKADPNNNQQYVIGAGDNLGISVYRAPELSVPGLPVRPDGRISMPLIPDIIAAGKTPTQLGKELEERLREYVKDPIVTVMVTGFIGPFSRQVRVIGEAADPQAISYRDHMTVLDVMIAVKGLTKFAAGNSAVIVRRVGDKRETIKVRLADLLKDGDIDQNVEMQPGDTLIIPQSWF